MIVVYFAATKFDKVGKKDPVTGEFKQFFPVDLPEAQDDCETMRKVLDYYMIHDEHDRVYNLTDPSEEEFFRVYYEIAKLLQEGKQNKINYLTIFLFAGHGIMKNGTQCLVLNEFDENTKFYKLLPAEDKIRLFGMSFQNSYNIAVFACCRELWNHDEMLNKCQSRNPAEAMRGSGQANYDQKLQFEWMAKKNIARGAQSRGGEFSNALSQHNNIIMLWGC